MNDCQRCENTFTEDELKERWRKSFPRETRLVGDYRTRLCDHHSNEWDRFVRAQELFQELHKHERDAQLAHANLHRSDSDAGDCERDFRESMDLCESKKYALHTVAHEWCSGTIGTD